jgi:hypothetical protein
MRMTALGRRYDCRRVALAPRADLGTSFGKSKCLEALRVARNSSDRRQVDMAGVTNPSRRHVTCSSGLFDQARVIRVGATPSIALGVPGFRGWV